VTGAEQHVTQSMLAEHEDSVAHTHYSDCDTLQLWKDPAVAQDCPGAIGPPCAGSCECRHM
jgi:hypothetical protein